MRYASVSGSLSADCADLSCLACLCVYFQHEGVGDHGDLCRHRCAADRAGIGHHTRGRTGSRRCNDSVDGRVACGGDRFGISVAAVGACMGLNACRRAGRGLRHSRRVSVAGGRDGLGIAVAAVGAGIGLHTSRRAARGLGHGRGIAVAEGGDRLGIAVAAVGAGKGPDAICRAARRCLCRLITVAGGSDRLFFCSLTR